MAHFQNQADSNPIRRDEYGNPVHNHSTIGTGTGAFGTTTGIAGTGLHHHYGGGHAILHRSGTGSSSCSEDDGNGGRRKKGLKQKIKEKLPGGHDHHSSGSGSGSGVSTTTSTGDYGTGQHHQKKGIMEKIKEKLPGINN